MPAPNDTPMKPLIFGTRSIIAWQQEAKTQTRRLVSSNARSLNSGSWGRMLILTSGGHILMTRNIGLSSRRLKN